MTNKLFSILICPFCASGSGEMQIDKVALRDFASANTQRLKNQERLVKPKDKVFWFGYAPTRAEPCEHVFHLEIFINRRTLHKEGRASHDWEATFRTQHRQMLEMDADDIGRNVFYESIYLQSSPIRSPEFRPATPHAVTNWLDYRWRDEDFRDGQVIYTDLLVHAVLTESFSDFLSELRCFADRDST